VYVTRANISGRRFFVVRCEFSNCLFVQTIAPCTPHFAATSSSRKQLLQSIRSHRATLRVVPRSAGADAAVQGGQQRLQLGGADHHQGSYHPRGVPSSLRAGVTAAVY
jgi:hypothetical protein